MKKLYFALAASAMAIMASATSYSGETRQLLPERTVKAVNFGTTDFSYTQMYETPSESIQLMSARKADGDLNSIEGEWIFQFGDYYLEEGLGTSFTASFQASISEGYLWFEDPTKVRQPFECPYEEGMTELVFPQLFSTAYQMPDGTRYFVYQEPFKYIWATGNIEHTDLIGTWNPEDGSLTFPEYSGLQWAAYFSADPNPANLYSYIDVFDFEGAYLNLTDDAGWRDFGDALFMDGWFIPGLGYDQRLQENQWYVPMQQHKINKYLFRLVDPYHLGLFAPEDEGGKITNPSQVTGYIQFDISDAKHVLFDKVNAGIEGGSGMNKFNKFYCYNMLKWYMNTQNVSFAEAVMTFDLGDFYYPSTVFEDNTVKLSYVVQRDGNICYDANFGIAMNYDGPLADGGLGCKLEDGQQANMLASITFPSDYVYTGVETILPEDAANGPAEYFNLQGIKVAHPEAGQLLIKRQGGKTEKIVY